MLLRRGGEHPPQRFVAYPDRFFFAVISFRHGWFDLIEGFPRARIERAKVSVRIESRVQFEPAS